MCYAIPGKVKELKGNVAVLDYFGELRRAHYEMTDLRVDEYVYAQGGYVINKVPLREAEEILSAWKTMFFELQEVDLRLSRAGIEKISADAAIKRILDKAMEGKPPARDELLYLLKCRDRSTLDLVFKSANFLRQKYLKNACCVHGILEISNHCRENCRYCGISTHHKALTRYRMTPDEIMAVACEAVEKYGFKALVLQSGEDPGYSIDEFARIIRMIKEKTPCLIFISFGEIGIPGLRKLHDAGARGLLMRFETSNPKLYAESHPGRSLETRLEHLRKAYEMGYLIVTGGLIGLPDQTLADIVDDIFLAKELHAEMYSFGPFLPHPQTPLGKVLPVHEIEMLKVIAVARLLDPKEARILVTTAFETLSPDARRKGLLAGANSVMLNITPVEYRERYAIYPNRVYAHETVRKQIDETLVLLKELGRAPTDLGAKVH
ncbi:MAG: radical SAM protein [Candidatus Omnitrophota bacterium]